jgi:hypothetical protein
MSHSPEPWGYRPHSLNSQHADIFAAAERGPGAEITVLLSWIGRQDDEDVAVACLDIEDAARIVACVNFCQHLPTEFLEARRLIYMNPDSELRNAADIRGFDGFVAATLLPIAKDN